MIINEDLHNVGGLVVIVGENNVGKSNVIRALNCVDGGLNKEDKPNFDYTKNPELSLCYEYMGEPDFIGKFFVLYLIQSALDRGLELSGLETLERYQESLQTMCDRSSFLILHDIDEQTGREEILLILDDELDSKKTIFLCSMEKDKKLECFAVIEREKVTIKNYDKALKLKCKICIDLEKKKEYDDANELKDYLKEKYENNQNPVKKLRQESFKVYLDEGGQIQYEDSLYAPQTFDQEQLRAGVMDLIKEYRYEQPSEKTILEIFKKAENICKGAVRDTRIENPDEAIKLINYAPSSMQAQFSIRVRPNIIFYEQRDVKNEDLIIEGQDDSIIKQEDMESSRLFPSLFKCLGKDLQEVVKVYQQSRESNIPYYEEFEVV